MSIDIYLEAVLFAAFSSLTKDFCIANIQRQYLLRMCAHRKELLLIIFMCQDYLCGHLMRQYITAKVEYLMKRIELIAKYFLQIIFKGLVLLHQVFGNSKYSSQSADSSKIAEDILLGGMSINLSQCLLNHYSI